MTTEANKAESSSSTYDENCSELIDLSGAEKITIGADVDAEAEADTASAEQQQLLECESKVQTEECEPIPAKTNTTKEPDMEDKNKQVIKEIAVVQEKQEEHLDTISLSELRNQEELEMMQDVTKDPLAPPQNDILSHVHCLAQLEEQRRNYERQLEQLRTANSQKDNMMTLLQRENAILEKEKQAFRNEMDMANKEKEATVIKFAMREKLLIDAKKEKDAVEKQLADARKEVKNVSTRFQAVNEEKSRITYIIDEKVCAAPTDNIENLL